VTEWLVALLGAVVAGAGVAALATALHVRLRLLNQIDLVGPFVGIAVVLVARSWAGEGRAGPLGDALLLLPIAAALGYLLALAVGDRLAVEADPVLGLTTAVLGAVVADRLLVARAGFDPGRLAETSSAVLSRDGVALLSMAAAVAAVLAIVSVLAVGAVFALGPSSRLLRSWQEDPDLVVLGGRDPVRLGARLAALTAVVASVGVAAYASVVAVNGASGFGLLGRTAEVLLVAGTTRLRRIVAAAFGLEVARAVADQLVSGWGAVIIPAVALTAVVLRTRRSSGAPTRVALP